MFRDRLARVELAARMGYLARALVYFMIGYLTLATRRAQGTSSVLGDIRNLPAGTPLLVLTAIGLVGYGVFRLYGAATDLQGDGSDAKGWGKRLGHGASGLAHLFLAYLSVRLALGAAHASGNGGGQAAQKAVHYPGGGILLIVVGAGFALAALEQAKKAATGNFMKLLEPDGPRWAEAIGRIGFAARAAVFAALAWKIIEAGLSDSPGQLSFRAALDSLRSIGWLYEAVAAGLLIFGLFSLILARYRRISNQDVIDRLTS